MADATASLRIKADADVTPAVAGLQSLDRAIDGTSVRAGSMAVSFNELVGSILTAELAMRAIEGVFTLMGSAIGNVVEESAELSKRSVVLTQSVDDLATALGRVAFDGDDAAVSLAEMDRTASALAERLDVARGSIKGGAIAANALNVALQAVVNISTVAYAAFQGIKIAVDAASTLMLTGAESAITLSKALGETVIVAVAAAIDGFASLIEGASNVAGRFGLGRLAAGADEAAASMRALASQVREGVDPMETLNEGVGDILFNLDGFIERSTDAAVAAMEFALANNTLLAALNASLGVIKSTKEEEDELPKFYTDTAAAADEAARAIEEATRAMNDQDAAWRTLIEGFNAAGATERERVREYLNGRRAMMEADNMLAGQLATAATINDQNAAGLERLAAAADALVFRYTAAGQAVESLRNTGALFASEFGEGVSAAFEAALGSADSLEDFTRAVRAALGSALVSSGAQTILEGLKSLIPIPGLFNPAAAAVALPLGATMVATGRAFGGKGSAPSGGGRSVGESGGASTGVAGAPTPDAGPRSISATNWDGLTIITEDPDTFRRLGRGLERTEAIGMGATI
jgi:hypothetical protein